MARRFTPKQERFVKLYPIYLNGTRAAVDAGYSPRSAKGVAHELLHNPRYKHVQDAIAEEMERINRRLEVTQDRIRREQATIAFANLSSFVEWRDGKIALKNIEDIDPIELPALAKLKQTRYGIEIELFPKQPALDALAKMEGMYTTDDDGKEIRLKVDVFSGDGNGRDGQSPRTDQPNA